MQPSSCPLLTSGVQLPYFAKVEWLDNVGVRNGIHYSGEKSKKVKQASILSYCEALI